MNELSQPSGFSESLHLFDSLHLCNYGLVIAAIGLITRNRFCFEFTYFAGATAVMQALLTPNLDDLKNLTEYVVYFIHHALIIQFPLWNVVVGMLTSRAP